ADFKPYRDELVISTKAGWAMWPGPYGGPTGTRKHHIASCEQSLRRMKLYDGISSYSPELTRQAAQILESEGVPLFIHQPNYSMLNRGIEHGLLQTLDELGVGCIGFSPLAQGLLSSKYLKEVPADARVTRSGSMNSGMLSEQNLERIRALNAIAERRGQTLA
ncbi:aldo/keto reductase, partial [Paraburkholderia phenazinium]|uniref:aldo/keto reductase n=1 Tax=Paraburkholderia phenazinium TaxID=60549 RepID=UPI00158CCEFE